MDLFFIHKFDSIINSLINSVINANDNVLNLETWSDLIQQKFVIPLQPNLESWSSANFSTYNHLLSQSSMNNDEDKLDYISQKSSKISQTIYFIIFIENKSSHQDLESFHSWVIKIQEYRSKRINIGNFEVFLILPLIQKNCQWDGNTCWKPIPLLRSRVI